ncbi:hypothetical protein TNCV_4416571 [Trichonephila clavipes]|uniref:Uncharacterized protein n=1 Tax=Trichonephila clavipes TaxID=2585209 RepID=A0A8X6S4C6_TRICX|nr:hypothetical protein TNCV_4416571 [Trichonephila clavipes]
MSVFHFHIIIWAKVALNDRSCLKSRFSKMMSMNSNKKKGRPAPNSKLGRSKFYNEKSMDVSIYFFILSFF